ncbi:MAG: 4Fe-4S binding protein [Spirochaetota bacterium]|nr:4Fe-4S binding protein [Spirochaetota bacterium]
MKVKRKIIEIDEERCDGCGQCVPACAEGAIQVVNGKAKLLAEKYCDGLGACLGECPKDALRVVERDVDEFDERAVEEYLMKRDNQDAQIDEDIMPCGCPSSKIQRLSPSISCDKASQATSMANKGSILSHWPVQIRLIPPTAPFLKEADLLVAADCTPVAYPNFHEDFINGKIVMLGCPKFDNAEDYIHKFAEIFRMNDISSITVVVMEVPCCSGLPTIIQKGMALAGKSIPMKKIVIGIRGEILSIDMMDEVERRVV